MGLVWSRHKRDCARSATAAAANACPTAPSGAGSLLRVCALDRRRAPTPAAASAKAQQAGEAALRLRRLWRRLRLLAA